MINYLEDSFQSYNAIKQLSRTNYLETIESEDEIDIFTDNLGAFEKANQMLLLLDESKQKEFFRNIIDTIKMSIQQKKRRFIDSISNLPVIDTVLDSDSAIVMTWQFPTHRIVFDIERETKNSFYGVIGISENGSSFSESGKLNEKNAYDVIEYIFDRVI